MKNVLILVILTVGFLHAQVDKNIEVPYIAYEIKMGKGFDAVQANCLMCHSFGYVINQGPQSRKFWAKKIDKMITHFKAPMSDKDIKTVTDYLFTYYGNGELE